MTFEPTQPIGPNDGAKLRDYKIVCAKLGLVMCAYFLCRMIGGLISGLVLRVGGAGNAAPAISMAITVIMVYVVPMLLTAAVFKSFSYYNAKSENFRRLYKKPVRLAQAIGTFPAMYGLGYGIAVLTFLASFLITRATGGHTVIEDILRPTTLEPSANVVSALLMVFVLVVIAPVFEEVWVRGIMYDALKPYGDGIAIIISSVLFGLMHGSIHMLFYTTALGFALGYVRYATNSLLVVTILHAVINAIAAGMLLI
ncbi:MAG: CPBP family intramembrane metalloprotease, partial [Oscillospiraceae bacterium]|nr:CPBP family intramembrane metalloprotease [Oscillospiraceae bacterium]